MNYLEQVSVKLRGNLLARIAVGAFLAMLVAAALTPGLDAFPDDSMNDTVFNLLFLSYLLVWTAAFGRAIAVPIWLLGVAAVMSMFGEFFFIDYAWLLADHLRELDASGRHSHLVDLLLCDAGCGYARVESASRVVVVFGLWCCAIAAWLSVKTVRDWRAQK